VASRKLAVRSLILADGAVPHLLRGKLMVRGSLKELLACRREMDDVRRFELEPRRAARDKLGRNIRKGGIGEQSGVVDIFISLNPRA